MVIRNSISSTKGNLWLFWNNSLAIPKVVSISSQMITVSIDDVLVSGVHDHVKKIKRKFLWSEMETISEFQKPWIVLGIFNAIISPDEKVGGIPKQKNVPWRFQKMWIDHPSFLSKVKKVWSEPIIGDPAFIFMQKLKKLKKFLSEWNWSVFANVHTKIKEAEDKVKSAMKLSDKNPFDESLMDKLVEAQNEHANREVQANTLMRLKSREKCIIDGSTNTGYFHAKMKIRQAKNLISELEDSNGNIICEQSQIADSLVQYFQQKFEAQEVNI
ncbi:uncharacterized protein LOC113351345 [Papaver somniferum]|uniref:uncharacterized protein LOC113351345 n=1 Tax=Papaver somniferum TaxID=3469 RepID=UPI000E701332|nr:uncharacterized protein LOC113351345 [Papaver somniferum]